ncbi:50S ribosomal protein L20 [Patescibacteria group bacterium]|nr:50S ribosomal protein L20 [Patescibacteria group bacterium]MBU3923144.1 50S ribosomal protein L20 [Patescibacteria group bacterium]
MTRVKRGVQKRKRKKKIIKQAKGFKWGRKSKYRLAKEALKHAWTYSYRDRRNKKRSFRRLWQIQINAMCRENGISYSRFINALKKNEIIIDRKILAQLVQDHPDIFVKIIDEVKKG